MKKLFAELTDVDGEKHVADLTLLNDVPSTITQAERTLTALAWLKVQDGHVINMDQVKLFKIKEIEE